MTVKTPEQVRVCLHISVGAGAVVSLLAVADSMNLFNFAYTLNNYIPSGEGLINDGRGGSTIGNPIGLGGFAAINLFLALALFVYKDPNKRYLGFTAACCLLGTIGSGQISAPLSVAATVIAFGLLTRTLGKIIRIGIPSLVVIALLLWPLVEQRINGFGGYEINSQKYEEILTLAPHDQPKGFYESQSIDWDVRAKNLRTYFLPEFNSWQNVVFGIRPQARVPAPEPWHDFIWIESGHLWLLWTGGVPFVLAFLVLCIGGGRFFWRLARARPGPMAPPLPVRSPRSAWSS